MVSTHLKHSQVGLLFIYLNWPRFCGVDRHHFMGQILQNMGHLGSRCIYILICIYIYTYIHMWVTSCFPPPRASWQKQMNVIWCDLYIDITFLQYRNNISPVIQISTFKFRSSSNSRFQFSMDFSDCYPPPRPSKLIFHPERARLLGLIILNSCGGPLWIGSDWTRIMQALPNLMIA